MDLDNPDVEIEGYYETASNETHFVKINALK